MENVRLARELEETKQRSNAMLLKTADASKRTEATITRLEGELRARPGG